MAKKQDQFNFEKSLKRIKEISEKMQNDQLDLDESLKLFEEGNQLIEKSLKYLEESELKVRKLIEKNGEITEENEDIGQVD